MRITSPCWANGHGVYILLIFLSVSWTWTISFKNNRK